MALSVDRMKERMSEKLDHWRVGVCTYVLMLETSLYKVFSGNPSYKLIFQCRKISTYSCAYKKGIFR